MNFLRSLSFLLIVSIYSPFTKANLEFIGIYEGSRLRIRNAAGDANTWGWARLDSATKQHFLDMNVNPQLIPSVLGYGNLGSIFIVHFNGDWIALKVKVSGGGGYNFNQNVDKYVDNPSFNATTAPTSGDIQTAPYFTGLISPQTLTAGVGSYVFAFRKGNSNSSVSGPLYGDRGYTYLTLGHVVASTDKQYYTVEVLDAHRDIVFRGDVLTYDNTCYQISIAGTPLNAWFHSGVYPAGSNHKMLFFGTHTFCSGEPDSRPSCNAGAMCMLNATDQNKYSTGAIKYGDLVRIVGLHTVASLTASDVGSYDEVYPWHACAIDGEAFLIGGMVSQIGSKFTVTDDPRQVFIVTSALTPGTNTPIYAEGEAARANDAIRLVPYWKKTDASYPYPSSPCLWFWNHFAYPEYSAAVVNPADEKSNIYNLFSLKAIGKSALPSTSQGATIQKTWDLSAEYQYFIVPVTKATTIADILTKVHAALTKPNIADKDTLGTTCMTKLETAIGLATTTQQCTYIKDELLGKLASLGVATSSLQAKLDARLAQITQGQAEKKEEQQNLAADEAARIAALKTKDITIMISALNDIITATPVSKVNVSKAIATAFTTATSLVKTAADAAALATSFANAIKKGYVTAGTRNTFDTRYAQIKKESAAVTALTQKTTLADLNNALASVVSYKKPITDGFATQILTGSEKAFGAAKAQWTQVQTLRKSKVARDAHAAQTTFASLVSECNMLAGYIKAVASMPLTAAQKNSRNKLSAELASFQKALK